MRIQSVTLTDGNSLEFGDFNVFIGGNAVGKTTLVLELYSRAVDSSRNRWFWTNGNTISFSTTELSSDLRLLLNSMARQYEGANLFYFSQAAKNLDGNTDLDAKFRFSSQEYAQLRTQIEGSEEVQPDIFTANLKYRRPFISFASCEARLNLKSNVGITALSQPPQDALNVLYRNGELFNEIENKVHPAQALIPF